MLTGEFIDSEKGRLFCAVRRPEGPVRAAVMVVPAFGDEMNKTRRMLTETGKRLNEADVALVVPDLFGTGDSGGAFVDASWERWIGDLSSVAAWASASELPIRGLIAVRSGALLAAAYAKAFTGRSVATTVFWQPVVSGRAFVRQMLRMRSVAAAVGAGKRESIEDLLARIESGEALLVGGYRLTRAILRPLIDADLATLLCGQLGVVSSLEVTRAEDKCGAFVDEVGSYRIEGVRFFGEPYWASTETVCDEHVVDRTVEVLRNRVGSFVE